MSSLSHTNMLFGDSGCLSLYAIEQYQEMVLSEEELALVNKHIETCPLCKEAVEGLSIIEHDYPEVEEMESDSIYPMKEKRILSSWESSVPYTSVREKTEMLNQRLQRRFNYNPAWRHPVRKEPRLRRLFVPAAASIIILMGLIAYFHFFFPEKQDLAKLDSNELVTTVEENEVSPVLVLDSIEKETDKKSETIKILPENEPLKSDETMGEVTISAESPEASEAIVLGGIEERTVLAEEEEVVIPKPAEEEITELDELAEAEVSYAMEEMAGAGISKKSTVAKKSRSKGDPQDQDDSPIYTVVEQMPEFPGGEDSLNAFIEKNLVYPASYDPATKKSVHLTFIIDQEGIIKDISVLRQPGFAYEREAIRLVEKMPPWIPGKQRDKPVKVQYIFVVSFEKPL